MPPKVQVACKAIVHEGLELDEAAKAAGLTTRALRLALERKHVIAFLKAQREVLQAYVSAQNIHHARQIRNSSQNAMARVAAMKFIDSPVDATTGGAGRQSVAGLVLILGSGSVADMGHIREIEAKPLIQQKVVPHEE